MNNFSHVVLNFEQLQNVTLQNAICQLLQVHQKEKLFLKRRKDSPRENLTVYSHHFYYQIETD